MTTVPSQDETKKRILVVDASKGDVDGSKDGGPEDSSLGEVVTVPDGDAALVELEAGPFDVVVTDANLPGMDGITLLKTVKTEYPGTIRILLSDKSNLEDSLQAMSAAHQVLTRACGVTRLKQAIDRACGLQGRLTEGSILSAVSDLVGLPSLPSVYSALMQALADPDIALAEIATIVEKDAAISAKLLQVVNSAFFGLPRRMTRIQPALVYLGTNTIQSLVLSIEVFRPFQGKDHVSGFSLLAEQRHSFLTAAIASQILRDRDRSDAAFMAGLLHDIGKLIFASHFPDRLKQILETSRDQRQPMHVVEKSLYDLNHADVGGYLLSLWGLPMPIVEAVAFHHAPALVHHRSFDVVDAVHVADALAHECDAPLETDKKLNLAHLKDLGVSGELEGWRKMASRLAADGLPSL